MGQAVDGFTKFVEHNFISFLSLALPAPVPQAQVSGGLSEA
jgi:hypothetical protein